MLRKFANRFSNEGKKIDRPDQSGLYGDPD